MSAAQTITEFLKWLLTEGVSHGFWHFFGFLLLINAVVKIAAFFRVSITTKPRGFGDPNRADRYLKKWSWST